MARQTYELGKNRLKRGRTNPRGYITIILIGFIMLVGGLFFNLFYQVHHLSILTQNKGELTFEDIPPIESWHNKEAKFVYLTFDDGPSKNADKILDVLDQYDVKGTFFVLGSAIEGYSKSNEVFKRMEDTGHYIGMHTMSHNYSYLYDN